MAEATIRPATLWDLFAIEALGRHGLMESGELYPAYDLGHVLKGLIESIERGLVFIAEVDGNAVGGLVIGLATWPQSPRQSMLVNEHLYVVPEHRTAKTADGTLVGKALVGILKTFSDKSGLPILFRSTFGKDVEAIDRMMRVAEFKSIGGTYLYEPAKKAADEAA